MGKRKSFDIAFVGLKPGIHKFEYEIDEKFFAETGNREFANCSAKIKLQLDKKSSFMLLKFEVGGKSDVICDRCNNTLTMELWDEFNMAIKLVENPEEMNDKEDDPDVYYIGKGESHLNVADWIYEFMNLSIPMQRMCKEDENGKSQCNPEVLEKLKKMEEEAKSSQSNIVWKGLDQFKDLK